MTLSNPRVGLDGDGSALLSEIARASRAIGRDSRLVLHGGGNSSVKLTWTDVTGEEIPALLVKGSGHDMATISPDGFTPLRLDRLRRLLPPTELAANDLARELTMACLDPEAPPASVESLVHALLPHVAVLHSHSDAILTLTNSADGKRLVQEALGGRVIVVDYTMPGPVAAAACLDAWNAHASQRAEAWGLVIVNHGLFTVGDTPQQALERHVELVEIADRYIAERHRPADAPVHQAASSIADRARLRQQLSDFAGRPMIVRNVRDDQAANLLASDSLMAAVSRGPITPDHVILTGYRPLRGRDVAQYAADYDSYHAQHSQGTQTPAHDPAPRVIVDAELGLLTAGRTGSEAQAAQDIYLHTVDVVAAAEDLGGYQPIDAQHVFELEHWSAERDKLARALRNKPLAGRIALVTGAASGIGRAIAAEMLDAGACVVGWDIDPQIVDAFDGPEWLGIQVDVTSGDEQRAAIEQVVRAFGGLDILVVSAGIFPPSQQLAELDMNAWRRAMDINVNSVADLFAITQPLLALAPGGGRVVVVASKNVRAPGPGAAAYSASKSALVQLSRVAALEWAASGIRVNMIHPDAVFDTALWTPELLAKRAHHYGMSVDEYKRRNLLRVEVTSSGVARLARAMVDDTFACTTGAQVPIDGGNERVI
ncbi:rhamnose utilization protein RhaD (predicted bifunctional aldolase and dehydrogenase)/NAD(P)-dependent dehydrogenase (short-subunit alcohol dehydrogenase family) [Microbacterium sp. W4I4]|uniref:SDR family oxidoreductase n=1 Tax=Microbacterium sp. W4I4 TaxID=3042295 RepID=UPI00277DCE3D|nr:SDR family oxidoreductase [Microbacterium sp. W4I4]MDQ0614067.1 rhamnose utilization protein RhaD (predicted bifunctional aldolase and dehydrogenase)/NAD(P)-dependent dehydrogenase (short-subunit alcohol dehydrogenase family) [Microbacterium sp. W4I4]